MKACGQISTDFTAYEELTNRAYTVRHEFVIVDGMETTLILGMDINKKLFYSLTFLEGKLIFNPEGIDHVTVARVQGRQPSAALLVAKTICIPGHSIREVPVTLLEPSFPLNATLEVEPGSIHSTTGEVMHLHFAPHLRTATAPAQGTQPYSIVIRNHDTRQLRLEQGCVIGRAHVVPASELEAAPAGRYVLNELGDLTAAIRPRVQVRTAQINETEDSDGDSAMAAAPPRS